MAVNETPIQNLRTKYTNIYQHEYEQRTKRFGGVAELITGVQGERYEWPLICSMRAMEYGGYMQPIVTHAPKLGKRSIRKRKYFNASALSEDLAEDMDPLDWSLSLMLPMQLAAMERAWDEVFLGVEPVYLVDSEGRIVLDEQNQPIPTGKYKVKEANGENGYCGGLLGPNYVGDGGMELANLDLSYTEGVAGKNLIPLDYVTTGNGVSSALSGTILQKLIYVKRKLEEQEVFTGTEGASVCMAISPAVKQLLCNYEVAINHDYGFSQLAENGPITLNKFLNVNFIVTNMLPTMDTSLKDGTPVEGARMCCAWLKDRVGVATWMDTKVDIREGDTYVDSKYTQITKCHLGASRKDEDTVFVIPVDENAI